MPIALRHSLILNLTGLIRQLPEGFTICTEPKAIQPCLPTNPAGLYVY